MIKRLYLYLFSFALGMCAMPTHAIHEMATNKAISYQVPTFIDEEHPEQGMTWKTEYCTNYTNLSELDSGSIFKGMFDLKAGWYVLDRDIRTTHVNAVESGVNIILQDDKNLVIKSTSIEDDGYRAPAFQSVGEINIYGQAKNTGTIEANGHGCGAFSSYQKGTTLNFYGGHIIANGDSAADQISLGAGIGGPNDVVNIYGGNIEAYGGDSCPGIACVSDEDSDNLNIYGGKIYAEGGDLYSLGYAVFRGGPGIGGTVYRGGNGLNIYGGDIIAKGGIDAAGIGGHSHQEKDENVHDINIYGGNIAAYGCDYGAGIGIGASGGLEDLSIYGGTIYAEGGDHASGIGALGMSRHFKNIKISGGDVTAIGHSSCGIGGGDGEGIYIYGGTVKATGGGKCAGIGGGSEYSVKDIYIEGGNVTAIGGDKGAGIGCGHEGTVDGLYIKGGVINATGGKEGAGIGGSYKATIKNLVISGGEVTAQGGSDAAGIGGGKNSKADSIIISGGEVTANGGSGGAGIGGGLKAEGSNITISGGNITAIGGKEAAGIGGGKEAPGNNITISGGFITAKGGAEQGAGIGGGDKAGASNLTISGGRIYAYANNGSAAIGAGRGANCGNIKITGGLIEAKGGYWGPGIGSGSGASSGTCNIEISNAVILLHAVDGGGYPAIGLGPWSKSNAKCNISVTGENNKVFNLDTMTEIIDGNYGTSNLLITNGTICPQGIKVLPVEFDESISDEDKARIEKIISKFNIKPNHDLTLMQTQMKIVQKILNLTDEDAINILADPNKHVDISLNFEVRVYAADFSNSLSPVIDYGMTPVATARLYDNSGTISENSIELTPADFEEAKGKIEVTMPVPTNCVPTLVRHTGDGGVIYNEFTLDGVNCIFNSKDQTVTVYIDHCSHLVTYFEPANNSNLYIIFIVIGAVLVGAGVATYFIIKNKKKQVK